MEEKGPNKDNSGIKNRVVKPKRTFLRKGTGMTRFYKNGPPPPPPPDLKNDRVVPKSTKEEPIVKVGTGTGDLDDDDENELKIFEKLEKVSGRESIGSMTSLIDRFIHSKLVLEGCLTEEQERRDGSEIQEDHNLEDSFTSTQSNSSEDENLVEISDEDDARTSVLVVPTPTVDFDDLVYLKERNSVSLKDHKDNRRSDGNELEESEEIADKLEAIETSCLSTTSLIRQHEQERVIKRLKRETELAMILREKIEKDEQQLENSKKDFEKYMKTERQKLTVSKDNYDKQRKEMEKVEEEANKLRLLQKEYTLKLSTFSEKITSLETEWKRKSNRWETQKKRLEERIESLEKENELLKEGKDGHGAYGSGTREVAIQEDKSPYSVPADLNTNKKRIQFAEDKFKVRPTTSLKCPLQPGCKKPPVSAKGQLHSVGQSSAERKPFRSALKQALPLSESKSNPPASTKISNQAFSKPSESCRNNGGNCSDRLSGDILFSDAENTSRKEHALGDIANRNTQDVKRHKSVNHLGDTETVYMNGTRKYQSKDKNFTRVVYLNGDVKENRPDGCVFYFYSESGVKQYSYPSGMQLTSFSNGQIERKNPDGSVEIVYDSGSAEFYRSDENEELICHGF